MIPQLISLAVGFALSVVVGFPISYWLFRKKLEKFEIFIYSLLLGATLPPILSFLESYLIPFSPVFYFSMQLSMLNNLIVFALGIILLSIEKVKINELFEFWKFNVDLSVSLKSNTFFVIILAGVLIFVFYVNFLGIKIANIYYEFDPYFYMFTTQYLFAYGFIPARDTAAWPGRNVSHATTPLLPYMTGFWLQIYQAITSEPYSRDLLAFVANVYPPMAAMLLAFAIFEIFYHSHGKAIGLLSAFILGTMPIIIVSFSPGHAQEQPWGVYGVLLFVSSYYLAAVKKSAKLGIFAGLSFGLTLIGSKYFLVTALIAPAFMVLYSTFDYLINEGKHLKQFNRINFYMILVISIFYLVYLPYSMYTKVVQVIFGFVPVTLLIILAGFVYSLALEYYQKVSNALSIIKPLKLSRLQYFLAIITIGFFGLLVSPVGKYIIGYIFFTASFARPKIPLYMTVAEFAWSGLTFNFGSQFGPAALYLPYNILVLSIVVGSSLLILFNAYSKKKYELLILVPLIASMAYMGFSETKYILHFASAYAVSFSIIIGEIYSYIKKKNYNIFDVRAEYLFIFVIFAIQSSRTVYDTLQATYFFINSTPCSAIPTSNLVAQNALCMTIPKYWLDSMSWINSNVGPYGRVLSWWDYGHWINWFGNSGAVLRNDNAFADMDYNVAALFVMTSSDGFGPKAIAEYMNKVQSKYVLLDYDLIYKWAALNFLGCVFANRTNMSFAFSEGAKQGVPYLTGTSKCELEHAPVYILVPLNITSAQMLCSSTRIKVYASNGDTYCLEPNRFYNTQSIGDLYTTYGSKINVTIPNTFCYPTRDYMQCLLLYPSPAQAPTKYYNSTFYRLFFLNNLSGFVQVFPNMSDVYDLGSGLSFAPVRIFALVNYTGQNVTLPHYPNQHFQTP